MNYRPASLLLWHHPRPFGSHHILHHRKCNIMTSSTCNMNVQRKDRSLLFQLRKKDDSSSYYGFILGQFIQEHTNSVLLRHTMVRFQRLNRKTTASVSRSNSQRIFFLRSYGYDTGLWFKQLQITFGFTDGLTNYLICQ